LTEWREVRHARYKSSTAYSLSFSSRIRYALYDGSKPFESKIVFEDELTAYLDEGWDLVKELSNGKIVIRRLLAT